MSPGLLSVGLPDARRPRKASEEIRLQPDPIGWGRFLWGLHIMREHRDPAFICWICELVSELLFFLDVICPLFLMGVEVCKLLRADEDISRQA
jgi:hypothetical protein